MHLRSSLNLSLYSSVTAYPILTLMIKPSYAAKLKITDVSKVARHRLCIGCGACVYACPEQRVRLVDIIDDGIRPIIDGTSCGSCDLCLDVCPGFTTKTFDPEPQVSGIPSMAKRWGKVLAMYEGYALDPKVRFNGSSGGLCTALALFCVENGNAGGVLHIKGDSNRPYQNITTRSTTREDLEKTTGSRYAPASPCNMLDAIEQAADSSVFIGKPCDVAALRMAQKTNPDLAGKIALAIGFFCAGTPSTLGTLELIERQGSDPEAIREIRYRGKGWPGRATIWAQDEDRPSVQLSYEESWGFLQKYRPYRCYLCPDLTAEFADISVGDPWYRERREGDPGQSLILIRTERGKAIFQAAVDAGFVKASPVANDILYRSQKNLLGKRQAIWGRLLAMQILGLPRPRLEGFHLFQNWMDLPLKEKVKSILGTARRCIQRNYFKPLVYDKSKKRWR